MTKNTPIPPHLATLPNHLPPSALSNASLRKMLPIGALFTSVYTGKNLTGLAPHGTPVLRRVRKQSANEMGTLYLSGPPELLGLESYLDWRYCRAEIDADGNVYLFNTATQDPESFLTISEIVTQKPTT